MSNEGGYVEKSHHHDASLVGAGKGHGQEKQNEKEEGNEAVAIKIHSESRIAKAKLFHTVVTHTCEEMVGLDKIVKGSIEILSHTVVTLQITLFVSTISLRMMAFPFIHEEQKNIITRKT